LFKVRVNCQYDVVRLMTCCVVVRSTEQRYNYLINGQAQAEIQQFMSVEHTTEEYTEVV